MPEPTNTLTLSAQYSHFSVGRLREGDGLSLVLPPETVSRLADACAEARARTLCMPPLAGMEAIEDLIELLHALFGGYSKVVAADALALRSTEIWSRRSLRSSSCEWNSESPDFDSGVTQLVRLWSVHPGYLDPQGLVALWGSAAGARGAPWAHQRISPPSTTRAV